MSDNIEYGLTERCIHVHDDSADLRDVGRVLFPPRLPPGPDGDDELCLELL